ncbi:hypothetical protein [Pseudarthrobacter sp. TAF60_1]|uniref:hypothetical protein n=1 Tax=Pseudarthrobacter sp. TAF60_1 TaxID=3233071 RepID=UPI003F971F5C
MSMLLIKGSLQMKVSSRRWILSTPDNPGEWNLVEGAQRVEGAASCGYCCRPTHPRGDHVTDLASRAAREMEFQSVIAATVGLVAGIIGAFVKDYFSLRVKSDESLRQQRLKSYQDLWSLTRVTPNNPKDPSITYAMLGHAAEQLLDWYYTKGGLVLSRRSQEAYQNFQKTLGKIASEGATSHLHSSVLNSDLKFKTTHYQSVHAAASTLRTALTDDLQSRNRHPWSRPFNKAEDYFARRWVLGNTKQVRNSPETDDPSKGCR